MSGVPQMHLTVYFSFTELSNQGLLGNLFGHISRQRDESQGGVWEVGIVLPPETWENWEQGQPWGKVLGILCWKRIWNRADAGRREN